MPRLAWPGVEFALTIERVADTELEGIGMGSRTPVLVKFNRHPRESLVAESLIRLSLGLSLGLCHFSSPLKSTQRLGDSAEVSEGSGNSTGNSWWVLEVYQALC